MHIELCINFQRMHALSSVCPGVLLLAQFSTLTDLAGDGPRAESCFDTMWQLYSQTQHQFRFPPLSPLMIIAREEEIEWGAIL